MISYIQQSIRHLLGEDYCIIQSITSPFFTPSAPRSIEEYLAIEEHSFAILCILYTWMLFQEQHCELFQHEPYIRYSLSDIIQQDNLYETPYALWEHIASLYKENQEKHIFPFFSNCFIQQARQLRYTSYTIENTLLRTILLHIKKNIELYPLSYEHLPLFYEVLTQYALSKVKQHAQWEYSTLTKKYTGTYYTPHTIAQEMAHYACTHLLQNHDITTWRIIDTSCGSGVILLALLHYISEHIPIPILTLTTYITQSNLSYSEREHTLYYRRYIIDTIIYGVDINPLALGMLTYCLQISTFIPYIPVQKIVNFRCKNALLSCSYREAMNRIDPEEQKKLSLYYQQYHTAVQHNDDCMKEELYHSLSQLYNKALASYIASSSKYNVDMLCTTYAHYYMHYELEFPEVFFINQGFTLSIGNPPWEKTKFEETIFIEQYHKGYTKEKSTTKKTIQQSISTEYLQYQEYIKEHILLALHHYKKLFPYSKDIGDDNIYRYFIEYMLPHKEKQLLIPNGYIFYILPTAFLTDESSRSLRQHIVQTTTIVYAIGFENRNHIFPLVDSRYKFSLLALQCTPPQEDYIYLGGMNTFTHSLMEYERFPISYTAINTISRGTYAFPEIRHCHDSELLSKIYTLFPALAEDYISVRRELDCAMNRELFYPEPSDFADTPLYQGAMIWQYNSHYAQPKQYLASSTLDTLLQSRECYRLYNDIYTILPDEYKKKYASIGKTECVLQYTGLTRADIILHIIPERSLPRFALRAVARNSDERSVICSLLPFHVAYQNSLFGSIAKRYTLCEDKIICTPTSLSRQLYAIGILNSLIYDWTMRFISAMNISKAHLHKLPFPQPDDQALSQGIYQQIIMNTLQLQSYHHTEFASLHTHFATIEPLFSIEEKEKIQIENDCLVAMLYNITYHELEHISSSHYFSVLNKKKKKYREHLLDTYKEYI